MGRDSGFVVSKNGVQIPFAYFRNYSVLSNNLIYLLADRKTVEDKQYGELYKVDLGAVKDLYNKIEDLYYYLIKLPYDEEYYEVNSYPKSMNRFYSNSFSPINASCSFPINKLKNLFIALSTILEIYDDCENKENGVQVYFYDSY